MNRPIFAARIESCFGLLMGLALLGGPAAAEPPATAPSTAMTTQPAATPAFVSGIVTLGDGLTPVAKADVAARPVGRDGTDADAFDRTADDGSFHFNRPLRPGTYELSVSRGTHRTPLRQLVVTADSGPVGLRLALPKASLGGRVTRPDGGPVAKAIVTASHHPLDLIYSVKTDDDGRFHVDHLLPGRYDLSAFELGGKSNLYARAENVPVGDAAVVQDLPMRPRKRVAAPRTTQQAAAAAAPVLSGTLMLADGVTPVGKGTLFARRTDGDRRDSWIVTTDLNGGFKTTTPVPPGRYRVTMLENRHYTPIDDVTIPDGPPPVLALRRAAGSLSGLIVDDAGQPVEGVTVDLAGPADEGGYRGITDATGFYRIDHVRPGTYTAMAGRNRIAQGGTSIAWNHQPVRVDATAATQDFGTLPEEP